MYKGKWQATIAGSLLMLIGVVVGLVVAAMIQSYQSPNALEGWQSLLGSLLGALVTLFAGYLAWAGIKNQIESESTILNAQTSLMTLQSASAGRETVSSRLLSLAGRLAETKSALDVALSLDGDVHFKLNNPEEPGPSKKEIDDLRDALEALSHLLQRHQEQHQEIGFLDNARRDAQSWLSLFTTFISRNLSKDYILGPEELSAESLKDEYSFHSLTYRSFADDLVTGMELEVEALKLKLADIDQFVVSQIHNPFVVKDRLSDRIEKYVLERSSAQEFRGELRKMREKRDPGYLKRVESQAVKEMRERQMQEERTRAAVIKGAG